MPQSSIFRWKDGEGWLVLSGNGDFNAGETEAIDMRMLNRSAADGPLVYIGAAHDTATTEDYLDYLGELGGRSGYPVDVIAEDDNTLEEKVSEAGIIVIGSGPDQERLWNGLQGATISAIRTAYANGALVMGRGIGAQPFGRWQLGGVLVHKTGFGWLENAAILALPLGETESRALQALLEESPFAYGLGIGTASALALGPAGQVEIWGQNQITISLGQGYSLQE